MDRRTSIITGLAAAASVAVALNTSAKAEEAPAQNPELEKIRAVLKAHDDAMTNHDLKGVMAVLASNAVLMGTGPGEVWSTPAEIEDAYKHFFEGYDKGQQEIKYGFRKGELADKMGFMVASGDVTGKKDGKDFSFPINVSMTVSKADGNWKIAAMHFSNLTNGSQSE